MPTIPPRDILANPADVKPVRIQRSRRKGTRLTSPNCLPVVCVTRGTKWGNPFLAKKRGEKWAVSMFRLLMQRRQTAGGT